MPKSWRKLFRSCDKEQAGVVVGLAHAQLVAEKLLDSDPDWASVIDRPEDACGAAELRRIIAAGKAVHGVTPDMSKHYEYCQLLAEGVYLRRAERKNPRVAPGV